ncbi:MAG: T9SS type A sorting domain-containing protein [Candidatus Krumholzibacteria bacterium]|nr:T9SS type A sorting domain-containing protein [Candidatus Krumholzibacteria bacterium]MDH4338480.1 T9SS type A sorting domain-containing protein [Candidatus Krumholzibacteria bacterium]MDH5270992.1 T9SS type A sorting domain-containing protein [Candidatus Krumholzibacteria bacterium]
MRKPVLYSAITLLLVTVASPVARAEWVKDGVLTAASSQNNLDPTIASDGAGGAIVAWADFRTGDEDIYVQRIDADGNRVWQVNGVPVCTAANIQQKPNIVPDGSGGAFIVWSDQRTGVFDIYAQRVRNDGVMLWAFNGIPVCSASGIQGDTWAEFDGFALLVTWIDARSGIGHIYAQRVDANANALWAANGVAVCTAANGQSLPRIISDGAAGAIVAWNDYRSGNSDTYAQSINFFGTPAWTSNGVAVSTFAGDEFLVGLVPDGLSGALVLWRNAGGIYLYGQRLDAAGVAQWGPFIQTNVGSASSVTAVSDGADGVIAGWSAPNSIPSSDVHAQRITGFGVPVWPSTIGAPLTTWDQTLQTAAPDGEGGVTLFFLDKRDFPVTGNDLYAQRVDADGQERWASTGVPVTELPGFRTSVSAVPAGDGSTLVSWVDGRAGNLLVYTQRIEPRYGWWGRPEPSIVSVADIPGDQGGNVALGWTASQRDNLTYQQITHYSEWRALDTIVGSLADAISRSSPGHPADESFARVVADRYGSATRVVTLTDVGADFDGPAIRADASNGVIYLWEFVDTQDALFSPGYSDVVATRQDSVGGDPALHYFQVVAHTSDPLVFFPSAPDSGYSVDNLAPATPLYLSAARTGGDNVDLDWKAGGPKEPDFKEYRIYRGDTSGFPVDSAHFLASTADTITTDATAIQWTAWYYRAVSVDVHGNQSAPSNEAMVGATVTGVGDTPALTHLQVVANAPNPFGENTVVEFGLPARGRVSIAVYDVAGRRVYARDAGELAAGWHRLPFDGLDSQGHRLASGVYFYRVSVNGETATHKMVIHR